MIKVRLYSKGDRDILRKICCDVADRGEPIENLFPDRECAADLLTNYYTEYEPENSFVAESEGQVVGYIQSTFDNRRYGLVVGFIILPIVLVKGLFRGVYFRREFWNIVAAALKNWKRLFVLRKTSFGSHQGHLHIGIKKEFRHQQVGQKLVGALLEHAKKSHVQELSASVNDQNKPACHFFEQLGFVVKDRYPMIMFNGQSFQEYYSLSYVKDIH